jgi:cytohesin
VPLYDLDGFDPLTLAAKEGKIEVVKQLLALKLSPNSKTADGYSPLLQALNYDNSEIASLLLDAGADPNYNARYWDYPLTRAAESGSRPIIEHLLKSGAVINATDHWEGQTALHASVMYRNYMAIEALLEAGADPHIKDYDGKIPEEHAYKDECITHLFAGGKIKEKPVACAPFHTETETGTVTFSAKGLWH